MTLGTRPYAQGMNRKPYPSDVSDEEWAFVAPYLTLMDEDAPQRTYPLREVFNALRWLVKTGAHWRMMPHDLPAWPAVYQQMRRWLAAGVFEAMVHDLRVLLRLAAGRAPQPTASAWRSSSCPRPSGASSCCPAAGWSSAISPGRRASAAWPATMNAWRRPLLAIISSPSLACSYKRSCRCSPSSKVINRL